MKDKVIDIFFDLDHTLWDFDRNSKLAFERIFKTKQIPLKLEDFVQVYEPINFDYWKLYREEKVTKEQLRRGRFLDAFKEFGLHFDVREIDHLAELYIKELPVDNHLFDGARDLLHYLNENYQLHIITNGFEEVQHLKLKNSEIDIYFDTVTTSEEVGVKKPNPKVFERALNKSGAVPEKSVMIGDTFEADILGAEAVGMNTIFFNYRNEDVPNGYHFVDNIIDVKYHF